MTKQDIIELVARYDAELKLYPPERSDTSQVLAATPQAFGHLRWMCGQIKQFAEEGRLDKCNRWLGFVQGALWALGRGTIDRFREDNVCAKSA